MNTVINTTVSENRGKPRIWIEGKKISNSFEPGANYSLDSDVINKKITLRSDPKGEYTVSVRNRNNRTWPLIELRGDIVSKVFAVAMSLRIVVRNGLLIIELHGKIKQSAQRVRTFLSKLYKKEAIEIGSVFTGLGVLDCSIHTGLSDCGIDSYTKFVVEREAKYMEACLSNQPDLFRKNSTVVHSAIEDVEFGKRTVVDVLLASLPCTGASKAGATKKKLQAAEFDSDCGAAFFYWLNFVQNFKPLVALMENVTGYLTTTSMQVIKSVLATLGYEVMTTELNGNDFGTIENRDRMCLIAINKELNDIDEFCLDSIAPFKQRESSINDLLEPISNDHKRWKKYTYLSDKEKRDHDQGKGFKRDIVIGTEQTIGTIRRLYAKGGSCDQFLKHPDFSTNGLTRLFTPVEHARLKGIPERLIKGFSDTQNHEMLGQSICYPIFQAVGRALGNWMLGLQSKQAY